MIFATPSVTGSLATRLAVPSIIALGAAALALNAHTTNPSTRARTSATTPRSTKANAAARIVVTTRGYDLGRTGWNRDEPTLSPSTVTPTTFPKLGEIRVDGKIEASPLYISGVSTPGGPRDLLVVAVSNNTVYAFDANTRAQVWSRQLGAPVTSRPACRLCR